MIDETASKPRHPFGITALSVFFAAGAVIAFLAFLSLTIPHTPLEAMWQLNPRAQKGFTQLGFWSMPLMLAVSTGCATAALGLWRTTRWGYIAALTLLIIDVIGDTLNAVLASDPRIMIGIPIGGLLIVYLLTPRVRSHFPAPE